MCGIVGWIDTMEDISSYNLAVKKMMDTLSYRGPDSYGTYIHENALLGHRRLIVIDPSGGQQPMTKVVDNTHYTIVYNGELYNTEDIRSELITHGYSFNSYSDTEVLLTSYIHWKEECVNHLNGIFAFCIFDEKNKSAFLARDHLGVKPLFYTQLGSSLIFASEIKGLLSHPDVHPILDEQGLMEIFGLGPATDLGSGIFKNINEIPPAHGMVFSNGNIDLKEYWELKAIENNESLEEILEHTRYLLEDAITRQLISDVPICTFLSGGLDSSIISAVASKNVNHLKTFSVDYTDNELYFKSSLYQPNSDSYYIKVMSDYLGTNHNNIILTQEALAEALNESVLAKDTPGMADVDSSLLLFCKEIKKHVTVGLSGECADEIFGGYPWFTRNEDLYADTFPWAKSVNYRSRILNDSLKKLPLEEYVRGKFKDTLSKVPKLDGEPIEDTKIREMTYLNIKWFMITLLNRKDRMSMRNSLEVRVPFADHRLVEYAYNIPAKYKLLGGREKGLLRESVKDLLPDEIIHRKKSPYPKTHNPIYTNIVRDNLSKILKDKSSPILDIIDTKYVKEIVDTNGSNFEVPWYGQLMTGPQVMALLTQIDFWLKSYNVKIL
ncbi:asparagine synthase (glutamine-hydrolyzing) [Alkalibaculum sp. M08DMB]|uniref:asparagine synthase (glutamine-hydrolyzing) n=1 Tax=Alkalibaculum sporogenes TaxID=2655001 RepID=A0A6A7KAJ4_9FIRM|nr:asparagine synthase (glutamine-hydrolyzing) [Alkalibaculum sporogenes]MPW26207.1 asparagine synthase (glutamine-hydrolyzing) [Alkalibaculum sporogenes]